jgi:hypothetical protein
VDGRVFLGDSFGSHDFCAPDAETGPFAGVETGGGGRFTIDAGPQYRAADSFAVTVSLPAMDGERVGNRDRLRHDHLGDAAQVAPPVAGAVRVEKLQGDYLALNDAVFTAPGAAEWLRELRRAVAALLAAEGPAPRDPAASDAIRAADPCPGRA